MERLDRCPDMPVIDQEGDIDAGSSVANHMDIDAGLFHTEADIKWLTLCEAKIRAAGNQPEKK